ncbi:MAG: peptide ABC transporter substrate-binding protein, partial [Ruminococcus sp.]|nr:peptide ABC transporter substrate-binding protein [Ruminococcus sp.]
MKKRILSVLLATTMLASLLAGCGGSKDDAAATDSTASGDNQLAVQIGPDPETIDPALNSASDGGNMIITAFEGLLATDENDQIKAGQAEEWSVDETGLIWTFKLREGLKWSDGSDLTAEDFVYSWKRVCDPALAAPYAETVLNMVKGYDEAIAGDLDALAVTAEDDLTLVVELKNPCSYFESLVAFPTLFPVQQETVEANGDAWAIAPETYISNGPFHVTEWVPGSHIIMEKNEHYWNADAIKLDSIKFALMEDSNAAYSAYQNGELDMIKDVPTEEIPSLQGQDDFFVDALIGTYYISFNTQKAPLDNPDVRKALSLAIDREYVANTIMQGTYSPAYNFMGPGWLDTDGTEFQANANGGEAYITEDYEAAVEEAKQLLADAGYADGFTIT